jgi:hypothetical protein
MMAITEDNPMQQFAPLLIGAGLLASVFWFGKGERRLPREFGSLGISKSDSLERDLEAQQYVLRNSKDPAQKERVRRRIAKIEAQLKGAIQSEFGSLDGLGAWPKGSRATWNKNHKIEKGTSVRVYDGGEGDHADKYTVVMVGKDWDASVNPGHKMMLGMSEGGRGVSMWGEGREGKHLGKRVKWEDLSSDTQKHIVARVKQA